MNGGAPPSPEPRREFQRVGLTPDRHPPDLAGHSRAERGTPSCCAYSGESLCGCGDYLVVWHVAYMLSDVPAMPEWVLELTVPVAPEHVGERLTNRRARPHRLREHGLGVSDVEGQHHRRAANRGWSEHPHLGELVGEVQQAVGNPQLDRHQPSIRYGDPAYLLATKGRAIEGDSALSTSNDNVWSDRHKPSVWRRHPEFLNVVANYPSHMRTDPVRVWRAAEAGPVLLMAGQTTHYAIEPRGEYVFGIVAGKPMRSRRGRERRLIAPGQLVAWDPSNAHAGAAIDGQPWTSRLILVETADLAALAGDQESPLPADIAFPQPALSDPELARDFLQMHRALESPTTRLEHDQRIAEWLGALIERSSAVRPTRSHLSAHDNWALHVAYDYLRDRPERNVGLDELAAAAGIGKFRLIRLFRERTGLPPHALQLAHRIRKARRLLESGESIADVAAATGFADQSHLHRHFQRSLGLTPGEYRRSFNP
jgi:AraC-like DNA-binding protein